MELNRRSFGSLALGALGSAIISPAQGESPARVSQSPRTVIPPKFAWGTSTSAYQTEGGNVNTDIWLLEHTNIGLFKEKSGDGCDHYHRYPDDLKLIASLGFNSYRFSIEWARVEPEDGEFSLAQLDHYKRMLEACHEAGLVPTLTLHHFSSPLWFARRGAWEHPDAPSLFARYCEKVATHLGDLIPSTTTINEINVPSIIQRHNYFSAQARAHIQSAVSQAANSNRFSTFLTADPAVAREVLLASHRSARQVFKAVRPSVSVGMNLAIADDQAVDGGETKLREYQELCYDSYLRSAEHDDFVAIQTYTRNLVGPEGDRKPPTDARKTQMGWEFYPEALEHTIRYTAARYKGPIVISENGIATENDAERIEYIRSALNGMFRCIHDGIDVRGYYHWSAFDNFEWTEGYRPKFGLIAIDRTTFHRAPKPSAGFLGQIARSGAMKRVL